MFVTTAPTNRLFMCFFVCAFVCVFLCSVPTTSTHRLLFVLMCAFLLCFGMDPGAGLQVGTSDRPRWHGDGLGRQPKPQPGLSHLGVSSQGKRHRPGDLQVLAAVASGPRRKLEPALAYCGSLRPSDRYVTIPVRGAFEESNYLIGARAALDSPFFVDYAFCGGVGRLIGRSVRRSID